MYFVPPIMKKIIISLLLALVYLSCKKEEVIVVIPNDSSMQLSVDQVLNDSGIVLKWNKYNNERFSKYRLIRYSTYMRNGVFGNHWDTLDTNTDPNHLTYTDQNIPLTNNAAYYLHAYNDSGRIVASAYLNYPLPRGLFFGQPKDILFDKDHHWLYITEENKISVVDYNSNRIRLVKEFPMGIGYCSLGKYNGSDELYVPSYDGWLYILNAATLEQKDRIYVAGYRIGSVVSVNDKLFVGSSDMTSGTYANCVKSYDRGSKAMLGRTGYWDATRLMHLTGTTIELVDLSINLMPVDLSYYQFDANGVPVFRLNDSYHSDYQMDVSVFRSFPDGSRFITSGYGTVFNKSLVFDRYLKPNGNYADFAFNDDATRIYSADRVLKKIDVIAYPSTTLVTSYPLQWYPYKIFRDNTTLLCISKTYNYQLTYLLIERVNL